MKLENLQVYQLSVDLGEEIWKLVEKWNYFEKDTIGKQLVRSVDSVAANLSEGFGRYHFKDSKKFGYYSRGSLFETKTWITKSFNRGLIKEEKYSELIKKIDKISIKLNRYIKSIGENKE